MKNNSKFEKKLKSATDRKKWKMKNARIEFNL